MRKAFDDDMHALELLLIKLSACANFAVDNLVEVMDARGEVGENIRRAKDYYVEAESLSGSLEGLSVKLLIHQQPVASDLRKIKSAMTVVYDLSRIAEMCYHAASLELSYPQFTLPREMLTLTQKMVRRGIDAYLRRDCVVAKEVMDSDDEVDADFLQIRHGLVKSLPRMADNEDWALDCLLVAKYLERIADHACLVAKETFSIA